ncbi:MAG TPA: InlB B-repeat-containing protein, partial [Paludibacteraceae bacterium]|nr:InlB B-repeat-containing protein [Paludibacteraceae bacterium]
MDVITFTINLNAKYRITSANLCGVIHKGTDSWKGINTISMKYKLNSGDAWTATSTPAVSDNEGGSESTGWRGVVTINPNDFTAQYLQITVKAFGNCVGLSGIQVYGYPFQTLTIKKNNGEADQTISNYQTGTTSISDPTRTGYRFGGWLQQKTAYSATWAQVFYHKNNNGANMFTTAEANTLDAISINDVDKFSLFNVLDNLRYDDTKYEFLLEYASFSGYNRWEQTSNPATTNNMVTGYKPIQISWTANYWRGLAVSHLRGQFTFIDGSQEGTEKWFYALGGCYVWSGGIPACHETESEKDHVRLWVRTNDDLSNIGNRLTAPLASDALTADNKYVFRPENATIKAIWIPNRYTVTYNGNGATGGSTANSSHTYDVFHTLTTNGFTKT